jgi:hypothetical protein
LHQEQFRLLLLHELDQEFHVLAIENVAFGHNMAQLRKFLCYLASHLGGQFTTQIEKQHLKINELSIPHFLFVEGLILFF